MNNSRANRDLYQEVTDKIICALEAGTVPWQKPWSFGVPAQNHFSGHVYRGINALMLNYADFKTPYFGTFDQVVKAGGKIRKGSKSETVYFTDLLIYRNQKRIREQEYKNLPKSEKEKCKVVKYLRAWAVFNMSDVEGLPVKPNGVVHNNNRIEACEAFLQGIPQKPKITEIEQNRAYYQKAEDFIVMPTIGQFHTSEDFYATLFHELAHATGHPSRLNRDTLTAYAPFGSETYSKEELIAEITTCFACNTIGISTPKMETNSHAYIAGWLKELRNDKKMVWEASTAAQKAYEFMTAN